MYTRRLAAIASVSLVLAACTTAPRTANDANDEDAVPSRPPIEVAELIQPATTTEVATADSEEDRTVPDPSIADPLGTTTTSKPTTTTTTAVAEAGSETTTTTTAPTVPEDLTELLGDLGALLSSLDDQLEGLDADLVEVDSSLSADEGDIGQ
ncbi:MAG: hypothetical protein GWP18_07010 [Proteobacteria bacterium]|nr:hypothetical protein [Pseudomonadota bacterium]